MPVGTLAQLVCPPLKTQSYNSLEHKPGDIIGERREIEIMLAKDASITAA
ncbi:MULTISPECIES: hypothetical protein [Sphingobium]|nr:hypothetical protein [Sphingobium sp. 15-1]